MQVFLSRVGLLFLRPGEAFRQTREAPLPWAGVLWGLLPAFLGLFITAWAVTRRWFDPYYSGMAGLVFGGGWVLSLASLALAARLLRGRPGADALTEASALAYTPILVGILLMLPIFLTTEGRNFAVLQKVPLLAVMAGATLWGAYLNIHLFREVAGFSTRRAIGAYLVSFVVANIVLTLLGWLLVWTH